MDDRFSRQADIVPRERILDCKATVIGVGAIGRQVASQLAAIGVPWMQLIDFDVVEESNKSFKEYITDYQAKAKNTEIYNISLLLGLDETKLRAMMNIGLTESNLNEFGRFDDLKSTVDKIKAKGYFASKKVVLEGAGPLKAGDGKNG